MIREATLYDTPAMALLWAEMGEELGKPEGDVDRWLQQEWAGLAGGSVVGAVAVQGGHVVGFADASLVYEPGTKETAMVGRHLYVTAEARGQGLGELTMLRLLALGRQSGASLLLTHGSPTMEAVAKFLGKPMGRYAEVKSVRF